MKVLISGAGIGGLTTALCCLHHGLSVTVLEKASKLSDVGAGIQIPPNAMKVFEALGIENLIEQNCFKPQYIESRMGVSGSSIFTIPLADSAIERWGSPYYHIHRADYISALKSALSKYANSELMLGCEVKEYSQNENEVTVELVDGRQFTADALIGADGIHSPIRKIMIGNEKPVFTGNIAWRAVVPISKLSNNAPAPSACVWFGAGRHCVTYRLRGGELANLVAVVECDDWVSESWTEKGSRDEALADFEGWHSTITSIISNSDELFRWALFDRPPLSTWTNGRVALLGDAAHPTLPFMAQGAAMAVEDAWAVSSSLANSSNASTPDALKHYQSLRYDRASSIQLGSRANAKTFHQSTSFGKLKTYGPMWLAGKLFPSVIHKSQDFLYGYDITKYI